MITLHECRIDSESNNLIISASIDTMDYYKNVYINSVKIHSSKTFMSGEEPIWSTTFEQDHYLVDTKEGCGQLKTEDTDCKCGNVFTSSIYGTKSIKLIISNDEIQGADINKELLFVYIIAEGIPESDCPCGMDNGTIMGVAVNLKPIYNTMMSYIKETNNDCNIPKGFIDSILKYKAFTLCLKTGNYTEAIKKWDSIIKDREIVTSKNCGCNGINA